LPCQKALSRVVVGQICFLVVEEGRVLGVVPLTDLIQHAMDLLPSPDADVDLLRMGLGFSRTLVWRLPMEVVGERAIPQLEGLRCWGPVKEVTGYSLAEWRRSPLPWPAAFHDQDRKGMTEAVLDCIRTLRPIDRIVRVRHRKGHWKTLRHQIEALPEGNGVTLVGVTTDVSELIDPREPFSQHETLFRSLTDHALFGVYLIQEGRFRYVNRRLAELFGCQPEDLIDRLGPLDLTHPQDRERVVENIRRRLRGEVDEVQYAFRGVRKDGTVRQFRVLGRKVEINGGPAILGTLQDITEERLRDQERSLTLAVFQALSRRGPREGLEGAFEAISGFMALDAAEVLILGAQGEWQISQVWARPSERASLENMLRALLHGAGSSVGTGKGAEAQHAQVVARAREPLYIADTSQSEYWGDKLRAQHGWRTLFVLPLIFEQSYSALLCLQSRRRDAFSVDHRRMLEKMAPTFASAVQAWRYQQELEAEHQRMRELVEELPVGVLLLDEKYSLLQSNEAARTALRALGARIDQTRLVDWGDFPLDRVFSRIDIAEPLEVEAEGPPARIFRLAVRRFGKAQSNQWLVILQELTAERQAEGLATLGKFAAGIAHDFSNVIGTVILHADLLSMKEGLSAGAKERLEIIKNQGMHAAALTQRILDFGRVSVTRRVPTSMSRVLEDLNDLLERVLPENITLEVVKGSDPCVVDADPDRLQQALMNLALNARDAMPEGGILRLVLDRVQHPGGPHGRQADLPPGEWIRLQVIDSGHGIPRHVMQHIFEPFFTTKEAGKGAGLGLAQTYGIVRQHEGFIQVDSEPGKGSTFTLWFPSSPFREGGGLDLKEGGTVPIGHGETILVVEDMEPHRRSIVQMLDHLNYRALEAADGVEALKLLEREAGARVDLVLTDVVMPGMDGRQLALALGERFPDLPVILMSGYAKGTGALVACENVYWLQKPLSKEKLARALRRALRRKGRCAEDPGEPGGASPRLAGQEQGHDD
jgi:PAS domain S-box-containing protein